MCLEPRIVLETQIITFGIRASFLIFFLKMILKIYASANMDMEMEYNMRSRKRKRGDEPLFKRLCISFWNLYIILLRIVEITIFYYYMM